MHAKKDTNNGDNPDDSPKPESENSVVQWSLSEMFPEIRAALDRNRREAERREAVKPHQIRMMVRSLDPMISDW